VTPNLDFKVTTLFMPNNSKTVQDRYTYNGRPIVSRIMMCRMAPFSRILNDPYPGFKVTPLFVAEYSGGSRPGPGGARSPLFVQAPQFFHRLLIIATDDTMFATLCGVAIHLCRCIFIIHVNISIHVLPLQPAFISG